MRSSVRLVCPWSEQVHPWKWAADQPLLRPCFRAADDKHLCLRTSYIARCLLRVHSQLQNIGTFQAQLGAAHHLYSLWSPVGHPVCSWQTLSASPSAFDNTYNKHLQSANASKHNQNMTIMYHSMSRYLQAHIHKHSSLVSINIWLCESTSRVNPMSVDPYARLYRTYEVLNEDRNR